MRHRLVILDRDGVINHDSDDFVKSPDEWLPIAGSLKAIARLSSAGFTVAVASNQSGVGRGHLSLETLLQINDKMRRSVAQAGGALGEIVFCPHLPDAACDCRKPGPGLLLQLASHYEIALSGVPMIGDSLRDLQAADAAGATPMLVRTGNGHASEKQLDDLDFSVEVFDDLAAAADSLLRMGD